MDFEQFSEELELEEEQDFEIEQDDLEMGN